VLGVRERAGPADQRVLIWIAPGQALEHVADRDAVPAIGGAAVREAGDVDRHAPNESYLARSIKRKVVRRFSMNLDLWTNEMISATLAV